MNRWSALVLIFLASALVSGGVFGQELERMSDESIGWWLYRNATAETIGRAVDELGARMTDLEVTSIAPLRFSACLVRNSGPYASGWWWYFGIDADRVSELLDELQARIIDLEVYYVEGQLRFAVILVPNTGSQAKAWWWYFNATADAVSDLASQHSARLVDLEVLRELGEPRYAVVMIRNSGSDEYSWSSWYPEISAADLTEVLSSRPVRILDLERMSNGRFAVILLPPRGEPWWWWYGLSGFDVAEVVGLTGGRIVDIEQYSQSGAERYAAVLTGSANRSAAATSSASVHESFPMDIVVTTTSDWTDVRFLGGEVVVRSQEVLAGAGADDLEVATQSTLSVSQSCCDITPIQVIYHAVLMDPSEQLEIQIDKGHIGETTVALLVPGETDPIAAYKHVGVADNSSPVNTRTFAIYRPYLTSNLTWVLGTALE